ncbi:MAG: M36 family metallopeptidase [Candidatus Muiribacteriota bacterium]|jgi:Zn-dependent metalloprotease
MKKFPVLFVLLFFVSVTFSFVPSDSDRFLVNSQKTDVYPENTWHMLRNLSAVSVEFQSVWNEENAVPTTVFGKSENTEQNILSFFRKNLDENINIIEKHSDGNRKIFQNYYGMTKIFPGDFVYAEDKNGNYYFSGNFVNNSNINNENRITEKDGLEIAVKYLEIKGDYKVIETERVLFDTLDGLLNAQLIKISSFEPLGDFLVCVDSETSDVLYCDNFMMFNDGYASVYVTNPLKSEPSVEPIFNIRNNGSLYGHYTNIKNNKVADAKSDNNYFVYGISEPNFDDAMVYYHMDLIHTYFGQFGYKGLDKSMRSTVYYGDKYDNAFFSPWGQYFAFGEGTKFNILSREASVIYHEYTHAVSYQMAGLGTMGEGGAMNEAFSDYFGNTITNDPEIGEWVVNKMNRPYLRSCINNVMYPEDMKNECHHDSQVYSAALWKIREAIGKKDADILTHFTRNYIRSSSKFVDGVAGMLKVDSEKFNGKYKDTILRIFAERGIVLNGVEFSSRMNEKLMYKELYGF